MIVHDLTYCPISSTVTTVEIAIHTRITMRDSSEKLSIAFATPIEAWKWACQIKADLERQMTPETINQQNEVTA